METKTGIVAFAFGSPFYIFANKLLAEIVWKAAFIFGWPIYTQSDIQIEENDIKVENVPEIPGHSPSTLFIAKKTIEWAKRKEFNELKVVAAQPHLWRCLRDLQYESEKQGLVIEIQAMEEIFLCPKEKWFCKDSKQKWVRSERAWKRRELIIRKMPMFLYKLITLKLKKYH